jgi:cellulose biosynthesis protein BcsQ
MDDLRSTFAYVSSVEHRLKSAAALLGISENTLRTTLTESGIEVRRANQENPNAPAVRLFDIQTIFAIAAYRRAKKLTKGPEGKKPVVIAVEIIKGGTGKTTTTCEVAVQLQLQGLKVMVIDIDIQANLTQLMGYESDLSSDDAENFGLTQDAIVNGTFATICTQIMDRKARPVDAGTVIKYPFGPFGPALIPSDTYFGDLESAIVSSGGPRELAFQRFFNESTAGRIPGLNVNDFDVVLFDCPPNVSFVATNAIACADIVIAPVKMESFSVKGLSKLVSEINLLVETYPANVTNPELIILPTYYSTNLPRIGRMQEKLAQYRDFTSQSSISQSEEFPKAIENYLPLTLTKPTCAPVKEYRVFVDYLIKKILAVSKARDLGHAKVA